MLAREELGVDVVRIWQRARGRRAASSCSPRPARPTRSATGRRRCPPPRPARCELDDGLVFRLITPDGPASAIALHAEPMRELDDDELRFLESLLPDPRRLDLAPRLGRRARAGRAPLPGPDRAPAGGLLPGRVRPRRRAGSTSRRRSSTCSASAPTSGSPTATLWWKRVHPEDRDRLEAEEQRCVETLEPLSIEYRMIDPRRAHRLDPRRGRLRAPRRSTGCWSRAC